MLNIFLRATTKACKPVGRTTQRLQAYSSFTVRDIFNESSDETGTLFTRFAKHIALEGSKEIPSVPTTIRYADFYPVTDTRQFQQELNRTPAEQLPQLIIFAFTYRPNADPTKFVRVLNDIDAVAVKKLSSMDENTVLRTLYSLLFLIPNWITRTDFYRAAVKRLAECDFSADATKDQLVQLCFYLGLDKKHTTQQNSSQMIKNILEQHLEQHLPQMSTMDLAVVCSAAFKTATIVQSDAYNQRLVNELVALPLDGAQDALMVTIVKAMRLQRLRSERVCERLASLCKSPTTLRQLQPTGLVHLFAYFAENLWDNNDCTTALVKEFMRRLDNVKMFRAHSEVLRAKDIAIFLWCCSHLNCVLTTAELQRIEAILLNKVQQNEFSYFADQLVDSCLSLWSLGHRSKELLEATVAIKAEARPKTKQQPKVESRLTVLLAAAAIEKPSWTSNLVNGLAKPFNIVTPVPAYLLKTRTDLSKYAQQLASEEDVVSAKLVCPINGINIPGLLVQFNSETTKVFVELLTDEQILHFSAEPVALMRLKSRLVNALGHKVVMLRPDDLLKNYTNLKDLAFGDAAEVDPPKEQQSARNI